MDFNPKYTITNKLLNNLIETHKLIVEINSKKIPQHTYNTLTKKINIENTYSTILLSESRLSFKKTQEILEGYSKEQDEITKRILNYYKVLTKTSKQKKETPDLQTIISIHQQLMSKTIPEEELGRYRRENIEIKNEKTGEIISSPPNKKDIKILMKLLTGYIQTKNEEIDPIILAGIFHKQFLIIHPFTYGNGNTTQVLTKMILSKIDFKFFNLLNLTNFYKNNPKRYFDEIAERGDYYKIRNKIDFTSWLEYFTEGILYEMKKLKKEIAKEKKDIITKLTKDQERIITYLKKYEKINDHEYSKLTKRKKSTRVLDFNKLIELDLIKREGKARQTYYILKS